MTARDRFPAHDREYHRMLDAIDRAEADADRLADALRRATAMNPGDLSVGLHAKYRVERHDGRDVPGEKHYACEYFVFDLTHDPLAVVALRAYADAVRLDQPTLADDLDALTQGDFG